MGINATTLEIRAIDVTNNDTDDAPMLPCLLDLIAGDKAIDVLSFRCVSVEFSLCQC